MFQQTLRILKEEKKYMHIAVSNVNGQVWKHLRAIWGGKLKENVKNMKASYETHWDPLTSLALKPIDAPDITLPNHSGHQSELWCSWALEDCDVQPSSQNKWDSGAQSAPPKVTVHTSYFIIQKCTKRTVS